MRRLLLFGVVLAMLGPSPAVAHTTIIFASGAYWPLQRWANDVAHVPTADVSVVAYNGPCPASADIPRTLREEPLGREVVACTTLQGAPEIYLDVGSPYMGRDWFSRKQTFIHELGHVYDGRVLMGTWKRDRLAAIFSHMPRWDGTDPAWLTEWVAESYRVCALRRRLTWRDVEWPSRRWDGESAYDYHPTPSQHRRICAVYRSGSGEAGYIEWLHHARTCEALWRRGPTAHGCRRYR